MPPFALLYFLFLFQYSFGLLPRHRFAKFVSQKYNAFPYLKIIMHE